MREHLGEVVPELAKALWAGTYEPGHIRRVWIPKTGGQRGLGIPNVVDRMVAEAVRQVLESVVEQWKRLNAKRNIALEPAQLSLVLG